MLMGKHQHKIKYIGQRNIVIPARKEGDVQGYLHELRRNIVKITTLPVYSKLSQDLPVELQAILPGGWQLSQHQVDTYQALLSDEGEIIFNTAMTGDGKSLAAFLPVLLNPRQHVFSMYPTNELLRDQRRQLDNYLQSFGSSIDTTSLWGTKLSRLQKELGLRTRDAILSEQFRNYSVLLTNPDIFNLVMNYSYGQNTRIFTEEELPYTLGIYFNYFIFDEFHIFTIPQIVAVLTAILYFATQNDFKMKYLFSSATPSDIIFETIQKSRLKVRLIEGDYATEGGSMYRQVLYPAELNFYKLTENTNAETWVKENTPDIVNFWKSCDFQAKGAIIVNSVASARRITRWLEQELRPYNISVGENTGLTDSNRRREALQKQLVIGTSTIDVGVDFNINYLVFESINAGTFLQRFGRLGRVKQNEPAFPSYKAHALLPGKAPWIYARIEQAFKEGEEVERAENFRNVIQSAFPQENEFYPYIKRWGILQPTHVIEILRRRKDTYQQLADSLKERYEIAFDVCFQKTHARYWGVKKHEEKGRKILDEVLAFRRNSPFQTACWDATVSPPAFISYDLLALVQTCNYSTIDTQQYQQGVNRYAPETDQAEALELLKYTLGHTGETPLIIRIEAFNEEHERLELWIGKDLSRPDFKDQVKVLNGFRIAEPRSNPCLSTINAILTRQNVVCYCTRHDQRDLRRMLHLPAMFPLFRVKDMYDKPYNVAFGKTALLLDSVMLKYKNRNLEDTPIII